MKRLLLLLLAVPLFAASPCASGLGVCLVNIPGDYTTGQLQSAIDDATVWQGITCSPYVIQITAGQTITGSFTLGVKTCTKNIEVRSSGVAAVTGRVNPSNAASLAKIRSNGGAVLTTTTFSNAAYYVFRGIEFTITPASSTYTFILVAIGDGNSEFLPTQVPSNIEFDRVWIHGNDNEEGPNQCLAILGNNISVHDSYIEKCKSTYFDSQALLIYNSSSVSIVNNYLEAASENVFLQQGAVNTTIAGNYIYKPPYMKYANGTSAPAGTCFYDASSGERYSQLASAAAGSSNVTGAANNGSGLIRVAVLSTMGWSTSDKVQVGVTLGAGGLLGVAGGAMGIYTITVIDGTHIDLQGSTFSGTWFGGGSVQKLTQLYYCLAGTWTTTSTLFGSPWNVKDDFETKGCAACILYGNVLENAWPSLQDETAIINITVPPFTLSNLQFYANKALNASEGFVIGNNGTTGYPRGPTDISIHDNLWPSIGAFGAVVNYANHAFRPSNGPPNQPITNLTYRHNTTLTRVDNAALPGGTYSDVMYMNSAGVLGGRNVFTDNFIAHGGQGIEGAVGGVPGWCAWHNANAGSYLFGPNIYSTVDQPSFAGALAQTLAFASSPDCAIFYSYKTGDTWLHTADYSTVFTTVSGAVNTWDYTIKSSYTAGHLSASDGRDMGADITLINQATAGAVSGTLNPWLAMQLKPPTVIGATTATIPYTAPTTGVCIVTVYSNEALTSSAFTVTDSGGNPARSAAVTGLTTKTMYWPTISCVSGAYILKTSAQVAPFVTQ